MKIKAILKITIAIIPFLIGCSVTKLHDRNNETMKIWMPNKDIKSNKYTINTFTISDFNPLQQAVLKPNTITHLTATDVKNILSRHPNLVLLDWYANCPSAKNTMQYAAYLDSLNIPFLLLSTTHHIEEMQDLLAPAKIRNKTMYVIPTDTVYSNKIVLKKIQFLKELCPECYDTYKDELMYYAAILYKENEPTPTIINNRNQLPLYLKK